MLTSPVKLLFVSVHLVPISPYFSSEDIRHLFTLKAIIVPVAWLSILVWAMVRAPSGQTLARKPAYVAGSDGKWLWLGAMNSSLTMFATVGVNIPDFTRYARSERAQYIQIFVIPMAFTLVGIAVTSAGEMLYKETLWDPLDLIDRWDNRPAAFFAALSFVLATLGTNISANSTAAANDLTALFPQYIDIQRGQIICAVLQVGGWVVCPWQVVKNAPHFLVFLTSSVFLGSLSAIMIVDYWLVHKGCVDAVAMYDPRGIYRYWNGINWRAAVALIVSIAPNLPGMINNINPRIYVGNATFMFTIAWLFGFFTASGVYWILATLYPAAETFLPAPVLGEELFDKEEVQPCPSVSFPEKHVEAASP